MTKLSHTILNNIKKNKIPQVPKYIFLLKNIAFWTLFLFAALIGATAFSVILLAIFEIDFEATERLMHSPSRFLITALPLTWIILFVLLFFIALFGVRHTKKGYKLSGAILVLSNIAISIILGGIFYGFGGAHAIEQNFSKIIPMYHPLEERREKLWSNPEKGLLSGEIREVKNETLVILEDRSQKQWEVNIPKDITHIPPHIAEFLGRKSDFPTTHKEKGSQQKRIRVKVVGKQTGENTFTAEILLPWKHNRMLPEYVKKKYGNDFSPPKENQDMMKNMRRAIENGNIEEIKKVHGAMQKIQKQKLPPEK